MKLFRPVQSHSETGAVIYCQPVQSGPCAAECEANLMVANSGDENARIRLVNIYGCFALRCAVYTSAQLQARLCVKQLTGLRQQLFALSRMKLKCKQYFGNLSKTGIFQNCKFR